MVPVTCACLCCPNVQVASWVEEALLEDVSRN